MRANEAREKTTNYIGTTELASLVFAKITEEVHKGYYITSYESDSDYITVFGIQQMLVDQGYQVSISSGHGKQTLNIRW